MRQPQRPQRPRRRYHLVHHLYLNQGDLMPICGVWPGKDRDPERREWHTCHVALDLLTKAKYGEICCSTCLTLAHSIFRESERKAG